MTDQPQCTTSACSSNPALQTCASSVATATECELVYSGLSSDGYTKCSAIQMGALNKHIFLIPDG